MFRRNTEKYITFSVPMKKRFGNGKPVAYKLKFFDSFRLMSSSSNKKCRKCKCCLEHISIKGKKLICKCIDCNKNYKLHFNKDLINTYEFFNEDINNLTLLLRKGVYPYEYMESWERFDETPYLNKEDFYGNLYMEIITDVDYRRAKIV